MEVVVVPALARLVTVIQGQPHLAVRLCLITVVLVVLDRQETVMVRLVTYMEVVVEAQGAHLPGETVETGVLVPFASPTLRLQPRLIPTLPMCW
jgi:hypothetical protein